MKREVLIEIINKIEKEDKLKEEGYLATHYINDNYESFIVANKKGVLNLVLELLKTVNDFDFHLSKKNHFSTIKIQKEDWFDKESHFKFDWIRPIDKTKDEVYKEAEEIENNKNKLKIKFQIFIIYFQFYGLRILGLIGGFLVLKWLFQLIF